jgi:hypothetical protein
MPVGELCLSAMTKQKPSAQIQIADGAGGMRQIADLRFEADEWPIEFVIPSKAADNWMAHFNAEVGERGWSSSGLAQLDRAANSGTLSAQLTSGPTPPSIDIVWDKERNAALRVKARPGGTPLPTLDITRGFLDAINARQEGGKTLLDHRSGILTYDGLPWRGELWLDSRLRLGPPSKYPTDALLGPQAIVVDAMIEGIGWQGVNANFQTRLHELRVFLSVVLGLNITSGKFDRAWVYELDDQRRIVDCRLGHIGYVEISKDPGFPTVGAARPLERRKVDRPGVGKTGISSDMHEQWVPIDVEELWRLFIELPISKREHFLRAGNAYLIAQSMWPDQRTAYALFLVVACEALKPSGRRNERANIYDVVASLMNPRESNRLREFSLPPQHVRSKLVHRGELVAGELLPVLIHNLFADPSFSEMIQELSQISRVCIIEWLRCEGEYKLVYVPRHTAAT